MSATSPRSTQSSLGHHRRRVSFDGDRSRANRQGKCRDRVSCEWRHVRGEGSDVKTGKAIVALGVLLLACGIVAFGQTTWISTVVDPVGGAAISPEGTMVPYGSGGTFTFTIAPTAGWSLNTVEVYRAADVSQPSQLVATKSWYGTRSRTLSFTFVSGVYEIRVHARVGSWYVAGVDVVGPGSVTRSPAGEPLPAFGLGYGLYEDGTQITLRAIPDPWCVFVNWSDDAGWSSTDNPLVITISGGGWSACANFQEGPSPLTITASAGPGGTIEPSGAVLVAQGGSQAFTIAADPGYYIADVQVDEKSVGAVGTYTFTDVTASHTISASFAIGTFALVYTAGAHGTIAGTSPQTVDYGADGSEVTATPDAGYHFTNWSDGVLTAARTDTNVTADKSVTASFAINARYTLTMAITPARGGTTVPVVGSRVYDEGTVVDIRATAAGGYRFVRWEGAVTGSTNPTTVTMTGNLQVRAVFVRTYTLKITVATAGGGATTPAAGTHTYDSGAVVDITAVPDDGYRFGGWTGPVRSPSSPATTITMTGNRAVSATFVKTYAMTISVTPVGGGTTSPAIGVTTYDAGSLAILRATASPGYRFDHWEGASTRTSERVAVRMDANKTATVVFVKTYTLTFSPSPSNGGTVYPGGKHTYDDGTVVAMRATARADYHFDHWEGALTGSVNPSSVTMNADLVLTAVFKRN